MAHYDFSKGGLKANGALSQGKRSDTLGPPVLEQSRPERAKALQCALDFYRAAIVNYSAPSFSLSKASSTLSVSV